MLRLEIPLEQRLPAITEEERDSLYRWSEYNGGPIVAHKVLCWLQSALHDEQRKVLDGWTWSQMAEMAGVRR